MYFIKKIIISSVRLLKEKFFLHDIFSAAIDLAECNARVVTRQLRTLILMTVSAEILSSHRYVVENGREKSCFIANITFPFLTEVQNSPSNAVE